MNEFLYCLKHYADISGRANCREFGRFILFSLIVYVIGYIIDGTLEMGFPWVSTVAVGGLFLPFISVFIRRLHDAGKSGWYFLLWFVPVVNFIFILYYLFTPGDGSANQYGPVPSATR